MGVCTFWVPFSSPRGTRELVRRVSKGRVPSDISFPVTHQRPLVPFSHRWEFVLGRSDTPTGDFLPSDLPSKLPLNEPRSDPPRRTGGVGRTGLSPDHDRAAAGGTGGGPSSREPRPGVERGANELRVGFVRPQEGRGPTLEPQRSL